MSKRINACSERYRAKGAGSNPAGRGRRASASHSSWALTYMVQAKKHTLHVSQELVDEIHLRVQAGREFQDAVPEILAANAELLKLSRQQKRSRS